MHRLQSATANKAAESQVATVKSKAAGEVAKLEMDRAAALRAASDAEMKLKDAKQEATAQLAGAKQEAQLADAKQEAAMQAQQQAERQAQR